MKSGNLAKKLEKYLAINKSLKRVVKNNQRKLFALSSLAFAGIPVAEASPVYVDLTSGSNMPVSVSTTNAGTRWRDIKVAGGSFNGLYNGGVLRIGFGHINRTAPNLFKQNQMIFRVGGYTQLVGTGQGYSSSNLLVSRLSANSVIGATKPFQTNSSGGGLLSAYKNAIGSSGTNYFYQYNSSWNNMNNDIGYVGFRFKPNGSGSPWHYGFYQVQIVNSFNVTQKKLAIIGYGYETSPGVSITPAVVLPVELLSFKAIAKQTAVRLEWTTASEENNAGFEIERSTDGKNFETLAFVEGNSTTVTEQEYFYDDKALRSGQYYYRLKQIDFSGRFEYSEVITASLQDEKAAISNFYPNPTSGQVNLKYTANNVARLEVTVFNTTGQALINETVDITEGENQLDFDFSILPKGNYFVKLQTGEDTQYQKLVIN